MPYQLFECISNYSQSESLLYEILQLGNSMCVCVGKFKLYLQTMNVFTDDRRSSSLHNINCMSHLSHTYTVQLCFDDITLAILQYEQDNGLYNLLLCTCKYTYEIFCTQIFKQL